MRDMVRRLSENNKLRASQVDTISRMIAASPYPAIVCGDFNDVPVSNSYRRMSRRLRDSFRDQGRGYSHTYRGFFDMLRIDYVLASKEFTTLSYDVIDTWGLEVQKRRRDTLVVRRFGYRMPVLGEGVAERLDAESLGRLGSDTAVVNNRLDYSDHYPVLVRLQYDGK